MPDEEEEMIEEINRRYLEGEEPSEVGANRFDTLFRVIAALVAAFYFLTLVGVIG